MTTNKKQLRGPHSDAARPGALTAVALAVMLLAGGEAANAAPPSIPAQINVDGTYSTVGYTASTAAQANGPVDGKPIDADLNHITGGTSQSATPTAVVSTPGSDADTGNTIGAYATGNEATNPLPAVTPSAPGGGIAALTYSANGPDGAPGTFTTIHSSVEDSRLTQSMKNSAASTSLSQTGNLVTAQTIGNAATSISSVGMNNGPTGLAAGISLDASSGAAPLAASASVVVGTVQENNAVGQATGSGASLTNNAVLQKIRSTSTAPLSLGTRSEQIGNTLSTVFTGNAATSGVNAAAQMGSLSGGSIAVGNTQVNTGAAAGTPATSDVASSNRSSHIVTTIDAGTAGAPIVLDQGSVMLQNNSIAASATGNSAVGNTEGNAGNAITLETGQSYTGSGAAASNTASAAGADVGADLAIGSVQSNEAAPLRSETLGGRVAASVQNANASSIALDGNSITAHTAGNNVSNMIAGAGSASINGTAALANVQSNSASPLTAAVSKAQVTAAVGTSTGSSAGGSTSITNSTIQASALGSQATNAIQLDATEIEGGNASADLAVKPLNRTTATADLSLNNGQNSIGSAVKASNSRSTVALTADSAAPAQGNLNDQLSISGNATAPTIDAVAQSNTASNSLAASATTLSASMGLINAQTDQSGAAAVLSNPTVTLNANTASTAPLSGSALTVGTTLDGTAGTGNTLRAIGYGNQAANTLSASATTFNAAAPGAATVASTVGASGDPAVEAAAGLLSSQSESARVSAHISGSTSPVSIEVGAGGISDSTVSNAGNALVASAYGNEVSNSASVAATNLPQLSAAAPSTGSYTPLANVTNVQSATKGVSSTIESPVAGSLFAASVMGPATGSTIGVNNETALAQAMGNQASENTLSVSGGTIDDAASTPLGGLAVAGAGGRSTADLAFTVQNVQTGSGAVAAQQTGAGAQLTFGGDVSDSTGEINGNQFLAMATKNSAANNTLGIGTADAPITTLSASGGVQNVQTAQGQTTAALGSAGAPALIQMQTTGAIDNATLSADGNSATATALSNNAANRVSVNATTLAPGAGVAPGGALASVGAKTSAQADYTASNDQTTVGSTTATTVGGISILAANPAPVISGSMLSVSNNTYQASAEANLATTELDLSSTNDNGATGALVNHQATTGNVSAVSGGTGGSLQANQVLQAPGAISNSSLTMSGNANAALGVANDANNVVNVSGANVASAASPALSATASGTSGTAAAQADYSLANVQAANGAGHTVTASASSQVLNGNGASVPLGSLAGSSVALNDNTTNANAYANRAANTLNLSGTNMAGTGALTNSQGNQSAVAAAAASMVGFDLKGQNGSAASSDSSIDVNGNTLQAQAVGNQATNALNAIPSTAYGASGAGNSGESVGLNTASASATYAMLNQQTNSGSVSATGTAGSLFSVALNGGAGSSPVSNSALSVQGNTADVAAFGNSASNTLTLAALNTGGASGALNSVQTNSGSVSAVASNLNFGVNVGGAGAIGGAATVSGNSITARAVGNAVSNTVVAHR